MDRLLKPDKLDVLPEEADSTKVYEYWLKTFESFIAEVERNAQEGANVDKLALLTNFLTPRTYPYISNATSYENAKTALRNAFCKRKNVVFARHVLMTRVQRTDESIAEYVHNLQTLAKDCDFEAVTAQEHKDMLTRDAFINGLTSARIRLRLLEEDELDLRTAVKRAEMLELAKIQSDNYYGKLPINSLLSTNSDYSRNCVSTATSMKSLLSKRKKFSKTCFFCGGNLHPGGRFNCPAKDQRCHGCSKIGHFKKVCLKSKSNQVNCTSLTDEFSNAPDEIADDTAASSILATAPACLKPAILPCVLEGIKLEGLLDSGASDNFISEKAVLDNRLKSYGDTSKISMASTTMQANVLGKVTGTLLVKDRTYKNISFGVVEGLCADIILGQSFMKEHEEIVFRMGGMQQKFIVSQPLCSVPASKIKCSRLFRNLDVNCKPIATKPRKYGDEDKLFIQDEVRKLLNNNIIEPSYSPWRAQALVTKDERHKRRMVIDYSQTINKFTLLDAYPLPNIEEQIAAISKGKIFSTLDLKSAYYQIPLCPEDRPFTAFEAGGKLYQYTRLPFGVTNGVSHFQRIVDELIAKYNLSGTYAYVDNITVAGSCKDDHDRKVEALLDAANAENLTFNLDKCNFFQTQIDLLGYRVSHLNIRPDPERLKPLKELPVPKCKKELQRVLGMFSYYARWVPNFSEKNPSTS